MAYTADALGIAGEDSDKEVGALAKPVEQLLTAWDALDAERRGRRRKVGRSNALVKRRDLQADAAMTALHNDVLGHVKLDREAPLFTRLFPDPLSATVRMALESQLPVMRDVALKLAEDETPAPIKKAHTKAIADAIERGESAVAARQQAFADAGRTSARIASWREDANHVLLGVEGALKKIASQRRLGTDWVDAHFPASERGKVKKKSDKDKGNGPGAPGGGTP